jgi:hypothetical protein
MKKSLANINYISTIKKVVSIDSSLLNLICYRGSQEEDQEIQLDSRIIDMEIDCRSLGKLNIVEYTPPSERPSHPILHQHCSLTNLGKEIYKELKTVGLCGEMHIFLKSQNLSGKLDFHDFFNSNYTFEKDQEKKLTNKLSQFKEKFIVAIPENGYKKTCESMEYTVNYDFERNCLIIELIVKCECSNRIIEKIPQKDFLINYRNGHYFLIKCENPECNRSIFISHNLYYCR